MATGEDHVSQSAIVTNTGERHGQSTNGEKSVSNLRPGTGEKGPGKVENGLNNVTNENDPPSNGVNQVNDASPALPRPVKGTDAISIDENWQPGATQPEYDFWATRRSKPKTDYSLPSARQSLIDFQSLAQKSITHLRSELDSLQMQLNRTPTFSELGPTFDTRRIEDLLHRYTTAIRDYEYMTGLEDTNAFIHMPDIRFKKWPDKRSPPSDLLRNWLKKILPRPLTWTDEERNRRWDAYIGTQSMAEEISPAVDRLSRFIVAMVGGLSLVVPMLIMRLHQNENKSLITTSVAVVLFSGIVSIVFRASNAETLGITAAYAAVLVVFVGTST